VVAHLPVGPAIPSPVRASERASERIYRDEVPFAGPSERAERFQLSREKAPRHNFTTGRRRRRWRRRRHDRGDSAPGTARTLRPQSKRGYTLEIEPASDDEEGEDEPDAPETQLRAVLPKHLSSPRGA
jgi:hypothetical protein